MLKRRLERLEARQPKKLRPYWSLMWREERDPFVALEELRQKRKMGPPSDEDAAELERLERVTPGYQADLDI